MIDSFTLFARSDARDLVKQYGLFLSLFSTLFVVATLLERKCSSQGLEYYQMNVILCFF